MTGLSAWIAVHRRTVLALALVLAVGAGALASRLPVKSDLSYLLPESAPSVRQLRALEKRASGATATFMLGIESADPAARARAGRALVARLSQLDPRDVGTLVTDDGVARRFGWKNRFLFARTEELRQAQEVLHTEELRLNPLYVDLDEEAPADQTRVAPDAGGDRLARLDQDLRDARARSDRPSPLVSRDGTLQLVIVRASFNGGDLDRAVPFTRTLQRLIDETAAEVGPTVHFGLSGDAISGIAEQNGLVHGMLIATALTIGLVLLALCYYFRSAGAVAALSWSLAVGTLVTFGLTRLLIGHLNIASAFLSSIVVGNGINFGIILLARYLEERRRGHGARAAVTEAMTGTARATGAAALAAGSAYLSLAVTPFRGFRDFGIIGGLGMLSCWVAAYTILPAGLLALERLGWLAVRPAPAAVSWFERLKPRRARPVLLVAGPLFLLMAAGAWHYLANDPLETNLRNLSSHSAELDLASSWMDKFDKAFGHGISGGFAIAVPRRQDIGPLVGKLRALDQGKPERQRLFSQVNTLDDLLPADQDQKLGLLAQLRRSIDRLAPRASDTERAQLLRLRPPDGLTAVGDQAVPAEIAWPFVERDGSRGRIVLANVGLGIDSWNTGDLRRFTRTVRDLDLGPDVLIGGAAFVFTDMLDAVERDGPRATLVAIVGAVLVILLLFGPTRAAAATIFCGAFGTLGLLCCASLVGLKVNFLDFVALPITIGIGIDYAVNIISRDSEAQSGAEAAAARPFPAAAPPPSPPVSSTASAVVLCSYTTVVGYGSLLISQNRGIRSFGLSAMVGEISCLLTALLVASVLARASRNRRPERKVEPSVSIPEYEQKPLRPMSP